MFKLCIIVTTLSYSLFISGASTPDNQDYVQARNGITKTIIGTTCTYMRDDEQCTYDSTNEKYSYTCLATPPSSAQIYAARRFEVLKALFNQS